MSGSCPGAANALPAAAAAWAPRHLRLAAAALDLMLAFAASLLLCYSVRAGWVGPIGVWRQADAGPWLDAQLLIFSLGLLAVRDVPCGQSPAKWLLCLRLTRRDGRRLRRRDRLLLVPVAFLPGACLRGEVLERLPYRVVAYAAPQRGLLLRAAITVTAAILTTVSAVATARPSIGRRDAARLAQALVLDDPILRRELGQPLDYTVLGIAARARERGPGQRASFELRVPSRCSTVR